MCSRVQKCGDTCTPLEPFNRVASSDFLIGFLKSVQGGVADTRHDVNDHPLQKDENQRNPKNRGGGGHIGTLR